MKKNKLSKRCRPGKPCYKCEVHNHGKACGGSGQCIDCLRRRKEKRIAMRKGISLKETNKGAEN